MASRKSSVSGGVYVLHIERPDGGMTYCGRVAARVNCADDWATKRDAEEICRACRKAAPAPDATNEGSAK